MARKADSGLPATRTEHSYRWAVKVEGQWVDLQCSFNDYGNRCEHQGTLSPATNGHGPWYCRAHFGVSGPGRYA